MLDMRLLPVVRQRRDTLAIPEIHRKEPIRMIRPSPRSALARIGVVALLSATAVATTATATQAHTGTSGCLDRSVPLSVEESRLTFTLPDSDDRPLYWTRLEATAAIRQWMPRFPLFSGQRLALIEAFDRASRGTSDITFRPGKRVERVIVSGFDPYTLDGGPAGTAPGAAGNNIRHGNPSGATALSIDGTTFRTRDGKVAYFEAYTLPVNYPEFRRGYLEDTVGPFMLPGPRQVDASITVSQAVDSVFNLEQWNGRYHGVSVGND